MNIDEMIDMYTGQGDFDYDKTRYQIESVKNYNRTSCELLLSRAPVAMSNLCKECVLKCNE